MKADVLRKKFLDFFKARKHRVVESDSLVPAGDLTVLFTPAGMNQFKKEFLGYDSGFSRAATAQRCLRTDDLDKVGKTIGHHTFFEMLGNFSFGDYFKEEAIQWAWEFLTDGLKIDKEKLWVSVYKDDQESYKIWKELIKIPVNKIIKLGDKENFWPSEAKQKGPDGPCGPCSEIFFDFGKEAGCGEPACGPSCPCGRFVEVWNLVFTQFNRKGKAKLDPLPKKNIDTGMGLERLAAVMQGVHSNFETDLFAPIIKEISSCVSRHPPEEKQLLYAVSDHLRAVTFAIYDGALPSNEARGYVVRKIIRKGLLHLRALGIEKPFLYKLVPVLAEIMKAPYPELIKRRENIAEIILSEEKSFISTLNSSENLFKEKFSGLSEKKDAQKAGRIAFQLYDTYGIPLELTADWLNKQGIAVSKEAFEQELSRQKSRSKAQSSMKGDVFASCGGDYGVKETGFLGYKANSAKAKVLKIIKSGKEAKQAGEGEEAAVILDKTVFYPESGGQVGDTGELIKGKSVFEVLDTKKSGRAILHIGRVKSGALKKDDFVSAKINTLRRLAVARNHTATHLLQAALRKVLGPHVQQQGSLVAEDRLRFDFTHFKELSPEELARIEETVNGYIADDHPLKAQEMSLSMAKKGGALAFFAEKYGDKVRVVSAGGFSKELCGGTHLDKTAKVALFRIVHQGSVASGIRRIEAVTGSYAHKLQKQEKNMIAEVSAFLNAAPDKIMAELEKKSKVIKDLERRLNLEVGESLNSCADSLIREGEQIKGIKVIARELKNLDMQLLRKCIDMIKEKAANSVIALGSAKETRVFLVIGLTEDLTKKGIDASALIRQVSGVIGGSGGGRRDFAQAGGNKPENLNNAFEELKNILARSL